MFSMIGTGLDPLNQMASGNFDSSNFNPNSTQGHAMRMMELNKKMLEKNPKASAYVESVADQFHQQAMNATAGQSSPLLGNSSNSPFPTNPGEAALMLEKEIKKAQPEEQEQKAIAAPTDQSMPDLGPTPEEVTAEQVAEVMKTDFEYGENDISPVKESNIFQLLTHRYQRSGLKRLFDEKGAGAVEQPAASDISDK
jgi:hypothetical protein